MPDIHERTRQLQLRLVYFGPPGSGKAANLKRIHDLVPQEMRSRMKAYDAGAERTVSFDMTLPAASAEEWSVVVTLSSCSAPVGKPSKTAMVEAADAVAFVADASRSKGEENHEAFRGAEELLRLAKRATPIVLQVNKRDRADAVSEEEIERQWGGRPWPIFTAAAERGEGVHETFTCLLTLAFREANASGQLEKRTGLTLRSVEAASLRALRRVGD